MSIETNNNPKHFFPFKHKGIFLVKEIDATKDEYFKLKIIEDRTQRVIKNVIIDLEIMAGSTGEKIGRSAMLREPIELELYAYSTQEGDIHFSVLGADYVKQQKEKA